MAAAGLLGPDLVLLLRLGNEPRCRARALSPAGKLISGTKKLTPGNVVIGELILKVPGLNPGQVSEPFYCLS